MHRFRLSYVCLAGLLTFGCGGQDARLEKEAQAAYYLVHRDSEDSIDRLSQALEDYSALAAKYTGTQTAQEALDRVEQLKLAGALLAKADSVPKDSLKVFYRRAVDLAPGYAPAVRKLGTLYYNDTHLGGRSAAMLGSDEIADRVLRTWRQQDSLWSDFRFRPTPGDREWQDRLCKQATDVARMLESIRRYGEALQVVSRGLHYGAGEDVVFRAKVFAAFYTFRAARYEEAIALAGEALAYEHLSDNSKGRAYHVIGLSRLQLHERTKDLADLDAAIEALNASVGADPSMGEARKLLKALREQRQRLAS